MSSEFMNACDINPTSSLFVKIGLPLNLLKSINELPEVTVSPWLVAFPGRPTLLNKSNWYVAWQPRKTLKGISIKNNLSEFYMNSIYSIMMIVCSLFFT